MKTENRFFRVFAALVLLLLASGNCPGFIPGDSSVGDEIPAAVDKPVA